MQAIEDRICDRKLLRLLRAMLRVGVMEEGAVRRSNTGTPQGGVISPLLANVYLDRLDRDWRTRGCGTLVRYVDDLVVMCGTEPDARRAARPGGTPRLPCTLRPLWAMMRTGRASRRGGRARARPGQGDPR